MKGFLTGLLVVIVLLVVGFFYIPSSVVPRAIAEIEQRHLLPPNAPRLSLRELQGTIWSGRANRATVRINGVDLDLGTFKWTLDKMSVLHLAPRFTFSTHSKKIRLTGEVSVDRGAVVTVRKMEGHMPLSTLEPWMPLLVTGDLGFYIDRMTFVSQKLTAINGMVNLDYIDWVGADYNMPLGSYQAELALANAGRLSIVINDLSARLGIAGTMTIDPRGNYLFDAVLQPREGLAREVAQSIRWLGREDGNGNVVIHRRGHL